MDKLKEVFDSQWTWVGLFVLVLIITLTIVLFREVEVDIEKETCKAKGGVPLRSYSSKDVLCMKKELFITEPYTKVKKVT